jgi:hypothetical protein
MKKSFVFINLVLLACIVALTLNLNADWQDWNRTHSEEAIYESLETVDPDIRVPEVVLPEGAATPTDVDIIGQQNLFHKSRNLNLPQQEEEKQAEARPVLKEPPIITGIIQIGSKRKAHVQRVSNRGQDVDNLLLDEGDTWTDDWKIKEIADDRLVLAWGDTEEEVLFHDPNRKDARKRTARRQTNPKPNTGANNSSVLTIGTKSAPAAAATKPRVAQRTPPRAPTRNRNNLLNRSRNSRNSRLNSQRDSKDKTSGLFSASRSSRSRNSASRSSSSRRNYSRNNSGRR